MNQRAIFFVGFPLLWVVLWGVIATVSVGLRPALPGFELPALAQAWGMWRQNAFLVSGGGDQVVFPLYLWLINATWSLFGVGDIWPRLLPSALGLGCTFMIAGLSRAIWPGWSGLGALSATVATGMVGWMVFASVSGVAMLSMLCTLVALYGVVMAWRRGSWDGFTLIGIGLGLGLLADGPLILVHILPVALLAPLWAPALGWVDEAPSSENIWRHWYIRLALSVLAGIAILMAWVVPLGMEAGFSAIKHLVPGLTADALTDGVDKWSQHWWLYLLALVLVLFPWVVWPTAWRALGGLWPLVKDGGGRFCLIWLLFTILSGGIIGAAHPSGVALHVPPLAMIAAYLLYLRIDPEMARQESGLRFGNGEAVLGLIIAVIGLLLIIIPLAGGMVSLPWWIEGLSGTWGFAVLLSAAFAAYAAPRIVIFRAGLVTSQMVLLVLIGMLAAAPVMNAQVNSGPPSGHLRQLIDQDIAVAFAGDYGREMDFPARLESPLTVLDKEDSIGIVAWAAGHPGGEIAVVMEQLYAEGKPTAVFPYMGQYIVFWPTEIIAEHPGIVVGPGAS